MVMEDHPPLSTAYLSPSVPTTTRLFSCKTVHCEPSFVTYIHKLKRCEPFVLYGCGTWSLKLRVERRLRVLENRTLRKIFGPKRDEVTGEWRKLHNEELDDLYSRPSIVQVLKSRRIRWAGHVARMG